MVNISCSNDSTQHISVVDTSNNDSTTGERRPPCCIIEGDESVYYNTFLRFVIT